MLPGPWGYNYGPSRPDNHPFDKSERLIARNCKGYFRLKLPDEVRPQIREVWPEDRPKYWVQPPKFRLHDRYRLADGTVRKATYEGGREYFNFTALNGGNGIPTRIGGGILPEGAFVKYPADTSPLLPRSRSMAPVPTVPVDSYPRRLIVRDDVKGFVACGGDEPVDYVELLDSNFRAKKHPIFANDELIAEDYNPLVDPIIIFQRDEYIFDLRAWPGLI